MKSVIAGLFLLSLLNPVHAFINNIINFSQLVQSVENGYTVRAIVFFNRCVITNPDIQETVIRRFEGASTGFNFKTFLHSRETSNERYIDSVSTSKKMLVEGSSGEFITLFSRLSVFEDNTAILHLVFFDALLHKKLGAVDWLCNLNTGSNLNINPALNPNVSPNFNPTVVSTINPRFVSNPNPGVVPNVNTTLNSNLIPGVISNVNPNVNLDVNQNVNLNQNLLPFNANQLDNGLVLFY